MFKLFKRDEQKADALEPDMVPQMRGVEAQKPESYDCYDEGFCADDNKADEVLGLVLKRIYLDHASATPLFESARTAMAPYWVEDFGNASAIHAEGQRAKQALTAARASTARILGVQPSGIVYTSGGTESNNLAIVGYLERLAEGGRAYADMEVITTAIEHPATLETMKRLEARGVVVHTVPVKVDGKVDLVALAGLLSPRTVLMSVAYVNSEIGVVQDCHQIARVLAKAPGREKPLLHLDAAQAPLWLPCDLPRLGADLMSLDGGKFGGPKGVGVVAMRKGVSISSILGGGGQEGGKRPGTEPLPLIIGLTAALEEAQAGYAARATQVAAVRDYGLTKLQAAIPTVMVNGPLGESRVANNIHCSIPGLDSEFAVVSLDVAGIAASTKSACSSAGGGASAVVLTTTGDEIRALSTLRFTLGAETTEADMDRLVMVLADHVHTRPTF
jgi:cysteine desulfurase